MSQESLVKRVTTFEQFRRFTTDAYGIERLLRALQSTLRILLNKRSSLLRPIRPSPSLQGPFLDLAVRIGQVRRTIRTFRFLTAFANGYKAFASLATTKRNRESTKQSGLSSHTTSPAVPETLLDGLSATFDGLYYLLEALTLPDALQIPGLRFLSPKNERTLNLEAQRCWFFALVASTLACMIRLSKIPLDLTCASPAATPVKAKAMGSESQSGRASTQSAQSIGASERRRLLRKMAISLLDMALPGSDLGWIRAEKGTVASVMLMTSLMTGADVWERVGHE